MLTIECRKPNFAFACFGGILHKIFLLDLFFFIDLLLYLLS